MFYNARFENVIGNYCPLPLLGWRWSEQIQCFAGLHGVWLSFQSMKEALGGETCSSQRRSVTTGSVTWSMWFGSCKERRADQENLKNKDGWMDRKTNSDPREPICPLSLLICQQNRNNLLIYLWLKLTGCTEGFGTSRRCFTTWAVSKWVSDLEWYILVCPSP